MPKKKKVFGQHFLRKASTVDNMIGKIPVTEEHTVVEIGCGDGFLTEAILRQTICKKLLCFEIDASWANVVMNKIRDNRLDMRIQDVLDLESETLIQHQPLVIMANLPYQITFPLFFLFLRNKEYIQEGVVMIQEEVAQKIVAKRGKPYGHTSILLQHSFDVELMEKVEPEAFDPAPKVFSRLLYFKPKKEVVDIPDAENFWKFLKLCFRFPRQTLRNNLKSTHYDPSKFDDEMLKKRSQQFSFEEFLKLWDLVR